MSGRDLLAVIFSTKEDEPVLAALEELTREGDYATAVLMGLLPSPSYVMDGSIYGGLWPEVLERLREQSAKEKIALEKRCAAAMRPIAVRAIEATSTFAGAETSIAAMHADLTIMLRPEGASLESDRHASFEETLFGSGRPVLLIPPGWRRGPIGRNIVVGWKAKREAARALSDAAPFIDDANTISVVTVDAKPGEGGYGAHPGADITAHLARKGVAATLRNVDGLGRDEGAALIAEAQANAADLIVIGGYGKARLREFVFGGVTRTLTHTCPVPILLSH